jgi:hypothetical protein
VNPGKHRYSWKILLSGYAPLYAYEQGRLDTSLPFEELKRRSHINAAAQAADKVWRIGSIEVLQPGTTLTAQQIHQTTIYPRITFVVWAGYDDNRPAGLYGGRMHGPIFHRFLSEKRVQATLQALLQE